MKTVIEKGMQSRFPLCVIGNRIPQEDCFCNRSCSVCHCEPARTLVWPLPGIPSGHNPFSSFPPWLPLWGSCHEVTERVKFALSASGTSPIGRGKWLSSARCGGHLYVIVLLPQRTSFQIIPEGHYRYSLFTVHSALKQKRARCFSHRARWRFLSRRSNGGSNRTSHRNRRWASAAQPAGFPAWWCRSGAFPPE